MDIAASLLCAVYCRVDIWPRAQCRLKCGASIPFAFPPFPSPLLCSSFHPPPFLFLSFPSLALCPPNLHISLPQIRLGVWRIAVSSFSGVRDETRPQTHFDTFTLLKRIPCGNIFRTFMCKMQMTVCKMFYTKILFSTFENISGGPPNSRPPWTQRHCIWQYSGVGKGTSVCVHGVHLARCPW